MHWYALAYVAGLLFAVWYIKYLARQPRLWGANPPTLSSAEADDFFIYALLGVVLGGRLGYVLFYKPSYYLHNPLEILHTWMAACRSTAAFWALSSPCLIYGRMKDKSLDRMLDLGAASVPVGLGLGRLANFINGELWGRPSDLPWAVVFPGETFARHPSQLYEALLEGLLLFIAVRIATHRYGALKHPGRAAGIFAFGYALSRIFIEFFREPDSFLGYYGGVFTMGMFLSLPLLLVGIWLLIRSRHTG